jgi:hypothetical protein
MDFYGGPGHPQKVFEFADGTSLGSLAQWLSDIDTTRSRGNPASMREADRKDQAEVSSEFYRSFLQDALFAPLELLPARIVVVDPVDQPDPDRSSLHRFMFARRRFESIAFEYQEILRSMSYLGPLRSHPARHYLVSGGEKNSVGVRGENAPQLIFRRQAELSKTINEWLEQFEIPYKLKIKQVGDAVTGEIVAMSLTDAFSRVAVSPSDVGFGVGQLLPIIVEGVVSDGRVVCVEQPEIHLHPRLQAHIADFLIETSGVALAKDRRKPRRPARRRNQWLVETHSEALMLRLQRRIRDGTISADDVCVLYVEPGEGGSRIRQLRLDADGEFLDSWPRGFFEEAFDEIFGNPEVE